MDPEFALAHAVLASVLAEAGSDRETVRQHLLAARSFSYRATKREASFVTAAVLFCTKGFSGDEALLAHVRTWPQDLYAVSLLTPSIASAGVSDGVLEVWPLLDELARPGVEHWWLTSVRAFARTEQGRYAEAEDLARSALAERPNSGHAAHALAHVLYEERRHDEAVRWIDAWMGTDGQAQRFAGHFSWHAALSELATGRDDSAKQRFDSELAELRGRRAIIDAGSLLADASCSGNRSK